MKYAAAIMILSFVFFLNMPSFSCGGNVLDWTEVLVSSIKKSRPSGLKTAGLRQCLRGIDFSQDRVDAAIAMWKRNERDYLELVWWRQYDRATRALILSLFYTQAKMITSDAPYFDDYFKKFSENEKLQREEELRSVLKNNELLRMMVLDALNRK